MDKKCKLCNIVAVNIQETEEKILKIREDNNPKPINSDLIKTIKSNCYENIKQNYNAQLKKGDDE